MGRDDPGEFCCQYQRLENLKYLLQGRCQESVSARMKEKSQVQLWRDELAGNYRSSNEDVLQEETGQKLELNIAVLVIDLFLKPWTSNA